MFVVAAYYGFNVFHAGVAEFGRVLFEDFVYGGSDWQVGI